MQRRGPSDASVLERLHAVIEERRSASPETSYVAKLLAAGAEAIAEKVREESEELIEAAASRDPEHTAQEAADLVFHAFVLLAEAGVEPSAVYAELEARFGTSGLVEKASRGRGPGES